MTAWVSLAAMPASALAGEAPVAEKGPLALHDVPGAKYRLQGVLGHRIDVNADAWLLRAPQANPGMLDMFRVRDRKPEPNIMPWAGEFVGKYLISAVQALRFSDDPALERQVRRVVAELIAAQADDGYLGPFPQAARLKGNWDLWGHYHCMQALLMWHERTGDAAALTACRRAGDLICRTFLDSPLRVYDAGSHEMNMAVIHGLGYLYRLTGEDRYLRMMREIEKDWERAGDYLRAGLSGVEFFESPRPRWESLHDLQGLLELHRITGDVRYRTSFSHHWRSIARWDRHNTGGFTTGEQATGDPYASGAIETCCTIAWMALSVDMLRLTGDPRVADELELATYNGAAGAQHPSGRWWTYNTPMDGVREASAHTIVFQARAGTPELNCCSVNAPRSLGMLSEWGVMADADGLVVSYYGPGEFAGQLADGTAVALRWETAYPLAGDVRIHVRPAEPRAFTLKLRVPAWSSTAAIRVNDEASRPAPAGQYLATKRRWTSGDVVRLDLDVRPRFVTGDREQAGKVSIYRGPLLLAYDQRFNAFDEADIPPVHLQGLADARPVAVADEAGVVSAPWLLVDVPAAGGRRVRLCDFANAGAAGTRYRSWLAAADCPPPAVTTRLPRDGGTISAGRAVFRWTGPRKAGSTVSEYRLVISSAGDLKSPVLEQSGIKTHRAALGKDALTKLSPGQEYFWKVVSVNAHGRTDSVEPAARFRVDPSLPPEPEDAAPQEGPDGLLIRASLHGDAMPQFGRLKETVTVKAAPGPRGGERRAVELSGRGEMIRFVLESFPEEEYTAAVWVRLTEMPPDRLGQVFSAWCAGMDDPLRICVEKGNLFARIEAGQGSGTPGVRVETGRWYHVAAVKAGGQLTLYVDGKPAGSSAAPAFVRSNSREVALGGNPRFSGNECLAAQFSDFALYTRALSAEEIRKAAQSPE